MTSRYTTWMPVALLLLVASITVWLARTVTGVAPRDDGSLRHDPDMIVDEFVATQFGPDGSVRYALTADKMVHYPDDDTSHLSTVRFRGTEPGQPPLTISSDKALMIKKGDEVFLSGNVVMVRDAARDQTAMTLKTDYMDLIPDAGVAKTDRRVTMENASTFIVADGMVANNKTRTLVLRKVHATLRPRPK